MHYDCRSLSAFSVCKPLSHGLQSQQFQRPAHSCYPQTVKHKHASPRTRRRRIVPLCRTPHQPPIENDKDALSDVSDSRPTYFATCARGLGGLLAAELRHKHIRAEVEHVAASGVRFRSSDNGHATAYRACLWLRTATRVLHLLHETYIEADCFGDVPDAVYDAVRDSADWAALLRDGSATFSVQVRTDSGGALEMTVRTRAKDAICDSLRNKGYSPPERPYSYAEADVPIFVVLRAHDLTIYTDMSGSSLHKRGYRDTVHRAALNEAVAAGLLYHAGFGPDGSFGTDDQEELRLVDPMCGSATLLIEAALLRLQVAVGLLRSSTFAFQRAVDFDADVYTEIRNSALAAARQPGPSMRMQLLGSDSHRGALSLARRDVEYTGLDDVIDLRHTDIRQLRLYETPTLVVSNPPWGLRLDEQDAWYDMGQFLRNSASNSTAVLFSGDPAVTRGLRMKARKKHPVRIGNVDCRVLVYDVLPKREKTDKQTLPLAPGCTTTSENNAAADSI